MDALKLTEKEHDGKPVYKVEVYKYWNKALKDKGATEDALMKDLHITFMNLYKQDRVMGDPEIGMVSTNPDYQYQYDLEEG